MYVFIALFLIYIISENKASFLFSSFLFFSFVLADRSSDFIVGYYSELKGVFRALKGRNGYHRNNREEGGSVVEQNGSRALQH